MPPHSPANPDDRVKRIKQLRYRANHRGIKEMDIVLGRFADEMLDSLSPDQVDAFESLMSEHDRDLLVWFTGEADYPHEETRSIFETVRTHLLNTDHG